MKKETKKKVKKASALFEIMLMISLTIAFSFIMSENVSAAFDNTVPVDGINYDPSTFQIYDNGGNLLGVADEAQQLHYASVVGDVPPVQDAGLAPLTTNNPPSITGSQTTAAAQPAVKSGVSTDPSLTYDKNGLLPDGTYNPEFDTSINGGKVPALNPEAGTVGKYEAYDILGYKIQSPVYGNLVQGLTWSLMALSAIQLLGGLVGLDKELTDALSYSAVGGIMAGKLAYGVMQSQGAVGNSALTGLAKNIGVKGQTLATGIGVVVAVAIFVATYKKTDTKRVQFQCLPWEAPSGGAKCEQCNSDPLRPCTEYRCRSLGQACELLNANTANAQCAWVSRNDVESPKIIPWNAALYPQNLKYEPDNQVRPPAIGSKILTTSNACLPAFTPLEFGFTTNEPAQCKVDIVHTASFDVMENYVADNYFSYNHTQKMRLPGPRNDTTSSIQLRNDGSMQLYIRCKDANGNENVDEYVFSFCVDKGPDTTPPIMEEFNLPDGSYVTYNADNVPIQLYVNEPAQCKWSAQDKNYDDMENSMRCFNSPDQVNADLQYTCMANVTGVKNMDENNYYFRCKDDADNKNTASKKLLLRGSQPLNILKILPNETVTGSTEYVSVDLQVETGDGAEEGKALCYFSETGLKDSYIQMFNTDNFMHSQQLSLKNGDYKYYFRCIDYGGNAAENSTEFSVFVDKSAPMITRAYKEDALKIVTDEDAQCTYSLSTCDFELEDGQEMIYSNPDNMDRLFAEWKAGQSYYIKCQDLYGNQPSPNQCSMIVSTVEIAHDVEDDDD